MSSSTEITEPAAGRPPVAQPGPGDQTQWSGRMWAMLIVLCSAMFLDALDNAMVGIAVPPIQNDLGMPTSSVQWVVSAYVLGFGGFLLLGGRTADIIGRKRVLQAAVGVFALASLAGGLAQDGTLVIIARFVMGMSAAFSAPAGLAIIVTTFLEGPARNRAVSIYTACGAAGFSLGLVAGGLLTQIDWRWTFLLPVPIAMVVLVGAGILVSRDAPRKHRQTYDVPGAASITAAMLLLVYTVVEAPDHGWASGRTLGGFLVSVLLIAAFAIIEKRTAQPLIRLGFLRNGTLIGAALVAAAILGTYMSFQFIGSLYLQSTRGWSPLEMALGFLPCGILIAAIAPRAGILLGKVGARWMMFLGFVAYSGAYLLFLRLGNDSEYLPVILPSMLLIGVAFPLSFTGANVAATSGVAPEEQGLAAGVLQTGYQIGAALVLAVVTATMAVPDNAKPAIADYRDGMWVIAGLSVVTTLATLVVALRARARARATTALSAG
jgi:MFS family permease